MRFACPFIHRRRIRTSAYSITVHSQHGQQARTIILRTVKNTHIVVFTADVFWSSQKNVKKM
jgi:hypothetical protein